MHKDRIPRFWSFGMTLLFGIGCCNTSLADMPERFSVDFTSVETELCGFPVEVHLQGILVIRSGGEETTGANYRTTFTNLETGKSVVLRLSGLQTSTVEASGDLLVFTFSFSGGSRLVVPGGGTAIDVGRITETFVLNPDTGDIISDEITDVGRSDSILTDMICQVLSN